MTYYNKQQGHTPPHHGQKGSDRKSFGDQNQTQVLPTPRPLKYFTDEGKKALNPDLLDEEARKNAENFKLLKGTQMRRFYDDLKAIERKIMAGNDLTEQKANFQRDRALIVMFKAKALYAEKRKVAPKEFTQFIFDHVASITDLNDFKGFLKVFEAVVAFHKWYSKDNQ